MYWRLMVQPIKTQEEADAIAERLIENERRDELSDFSEETGLKVYVFPVEGEPE